MTLPEFCLRRPVMTTLLAISVTLAGALAFRNLPVAYLPNVDFPTIVVTASYPGANPDNMATSVAAPLEKQFAAIDGVTSIISANQLGSSRVTLQFVLDRDINSCALDVLTAIQAAQHNLPSDLPNPPTIRKSNPSLAPVMIFSLHSASLPMTEVDYYAETVLAQRMAMVEGVAEVMVFGSQKRAVRIRADPSRLAARGLSITDISGAVQGANVSQPTGTLSGPHIAYTIEADSQLPEAADYRSIILARSPNAVLRLGDVASVDDLPENDQTGATLNGEPTVALAVQRQPGSNAIAVANGIKALLPELRGLAPAAVSFDLVHDDSAPMVDSVKEVIFTIGHTIIAVILITYVFLGSVRSTLIPALALPISLLATGLVFAYFGYSIDTLSLLALMLAVGFVTDDAVVVMENVHRHLEKETSPAVAAAKGASEIAFPIIGMTLSLAAVFIPFLLMGGVVGRLFSEFAVVIVSAILVSGVVSLTLTPLLSALFSRAGGEGKGWFLSRFFAAIIDATTSFYTRTLRLAMRVPALVLLLGIAMVALTAYLLAVVPRDFMPANDTGTLSVPTEAVPGASFEEMKRLHAEAASIMRAHPDVDRVLSSVGQGGSTMNNGSFNVMLKDFAPAGPRTRHPDAIANDLRQALSVLPGLICYPTQPPAIRFGGRSAKSQYQLTLKSQDTSTLYPASEQLLAELRRTPQLADVGTDLELRNPTLSVHIDRDKVYSLGFKTSDVTGALFNLFGAHQASTILGENEQYEVIVEASPELRRNVAGLDSVYLTINGKAVPLASVAEWRITAGPSTVNHSEQLPAVTLSYNTAPGASLGEATDAVTAAAEKILPASVSREYQGTAQVFQSSMSDMFVLLALAVAVIYVILGILYESYWHPVTILSGLPAAAAGGALALGIFHRSLDIYGMVGMVLLVGLVKKNAILVVDFALESMRKEGKKPLEAAIEGSVQRFRPIMMTTLAALAAGVIIAVAGGQSGETRRGLGLVMTGGLIVSQIVTLYLTPVVFQYVERLRELLSKKSGT